MATIECLFKHHKLHLHSAPSCASYGKCSICNKVIIRWYPDAECLLLRETNKFWIVQVEDDKGGMFIFALEKVNWGWQALWCSMLDKPEDKSIVENMIFTDPNIDVTIGKGI